MLSDCYPAREPKHTHAAWPTALSSLSFAIITSGLGKSIHGVIVFVGLFYSGNGRRCCDRSFYIWGCCDRWVVILPLYSNSKLATVHSRVMVGGCSMEFEYNFLCQFACAVACRMPYTSILYICTALLQGHTNRF